MRKSTFNSDPLLTRSRRAVAAGVVGSLVAAGALSACSSASSPFASDGDQAKLRNTVYALAPELVQELEGLGAKPTPDNIGGFVLSDEVKVSSPEAMYEIRLRTTEPATDQSPMDVRNMADPNVVWSGLQIYLHDSDGVTSAAVDIEQETAADGTPYYTVTNAVDNIDTTKPLTVASDRDIEKIASLAVHLAAAAEKPEFMPRYY